MQQIALRDPPTDLPSGHAPPTLVMTAASPSSSHIEIERLALRALVADGVESHAMPAGCRTLVHAYEPVRNERQEVIDFRLTFDHAAAPELTRSFVGIQVVQCGPSVAPGEIFHTLKHVLESGESQETVTRHVAAGQEVCFYQTAAKAGDVVVTTTSIVTIR